MRTMTQRRRVTAQLLKAVAAVFVLAMAAHSAGLVYYNRHEFPTATIGATYEPPNGRGEMPITQVVAQGPAERAGLRAGDRIRTVNGQPLVTAYPLWNAIDRGRPGDRVALAVLQPNGSEVHDAALELEAPVIPFDTAVAPITAVRLAALNILAFYPVPFLIVVAIVLTQRYHDRHAWLLAVLFASFSAGTRPLDLEPVIHPLLRKPLITYSLFWALVPQGALNCFFATFPERTPLDRRLPWLKVVLLGVPLVVGAVLATVTLFRVETPAYLRPGGLRPPALMAIGVHAAMGYGLGLGSLAWNAFRGRPETKRRTRVMLWGTAGAILPVVIVGSISAGAGIEFIEFPFWVWVGSILALFLLPLSFAYAVVKHQVMEIPVLLRRSARYVVVRHAIITVGVVIGFALTFAFAAIFSRVFPDDPRTGVSEMELRVLSGVAGALFGVLTAVATRKGLSRITRRVDRSFFREEYDARQLLQDLARRTRGASDRQQLAALLERSLGDALHPSTILVLLRTEAGGLEPVVAPDRSDRPSVDATEIARAADIRSGVITIRSGELPAPLASLAAVHPELLAAMLGHDEQLEGLIVLGSRLSDEPYSREDRELVASVAAQAGIALQSLRLAGVIADRIEAERRAVHELEIARAVQAKLLPQHVPALASLDYAGICIQARQVGGDYYDFLSLGPDRLGLVLADISGKGISAALLMASLQASLRSHYNWTPEDLPQILRAVNRTFFDSTETSRYATLFVGIYDEGAARLRYANCGHPPPVLLGADGSVQHLNPTAGVIGLFEEWKCDVREIELGRGKTLVLFSDGVVEAFDAHGNEFGEERLVDLLRAGTASRLPADLLVQSVVTAVQRHSGPEPSDDFTLIVVRGLGVPSSQGTSADREPVFSSTRSAPSISFGPAARLRTLAEMAPYQSTWQGRTKPHWRANARLAANYGSPEGKDAAEDRQAQTQRPLSHSAALRRPAIGN
jgi:phosphoserine phosphatase RsbU/P